MSKVRGMVHSIEKNQTHSVLVWILVAVAAFVVSMGKIMGYPSPVNVAFAVVSGVNIIPAFIGSVVSYVVFGNVEAGLINLCSILVIAGIRLAVMQDDHKDNPIFLTLLTTGTMTLFGFVMSVAVHSDKYTSTLRLVTALIGGCLVFVVKSIQQNQKCNGVFELSGINGVFVSILYIMVVSTLAGCPIPFINLGRVFGVFVMLAAVRKYKTAGGAVVGALTTCGILLCNPVLAKNTLLLATSGLICGAFMQFGVLVSVLIFIGSSILSLVAIGVNGDTFYMFADILAGSIIFLACPTSFIKKTTAKFLGVKNSVDLVGQTASSRLNYASKTLGDIRGQISLVSSAIDRKMTNTDLKVQTCVAVCNNCDMFGICWKKSSDNTKISFENLEKIVMKYNGVSVSDIENEIPLCCKSQQLIEAFNEFYKNMLEEKADNIKIKEMRELVTEQLSSMEEILCDLSYRVGQVRAIDSSLSVQVRDYFSQLGYPNAKACVYIDENNSQRVEVYLTAEYKGDKLKVAMGISSLAECDFDLPVITQIDNVCKLAFTELPDFSVDIGTFQASCKDNEYSGDTLETLDLTTSEKYIVLSDGMGTGKRAKLDSMFAVNLACRLLKAGISMSTAHRLINSILRVKGWEESFATLDIMKIDLCGGSAEFLKAGASPAYLFRDGSLKSIGGQSFPVGILSDCDADITKCKLFYGDIIILSSDGVEEQVVRQISNIVKNGTVKTQDIAQKLGEIAMGKNGDKNRDDISIAIMYIDERLK